jgi:hypothetical protein
MEGLRKTRGPWMRRTCWPAENKIMILCNLQRKMQASDAARADMRARVNVPQGLKQIV